MKRERILMCFFLILMQVPLVYAQDDVDPETKIDHSTTSAQFENVNALPLPVGARVNSLQPETVTAMQTAGMTWIKRFVRFQTGADATVASDLIDQGHQAGFSVLLTVTGDPAELVAMGEDYYPVFAAFLAEVAALGPDGIEIWQEMNLDSSWGEGKIDPNAYVDMLRQAYTAIKAANPDVMVITGALMPTMFEAGLGSARLWNDDRYYAGMAAAGVADVADCIGVRYLEGAVSPAQREGDPRGDAPIFYFPTMIERAMAPFESQDIPLCFTGLGYLSGEAYTDWWTETFSWSKNITAMRQAKWLRDAILVAKDDGRVALIIVDNAGGVSGANDPASGWSIIRPDNTCPACQAIGLLANLPMPEPGTVIPAGEETTATIQTVSSAMAFTLLPGETEQISISVIPTGDSALDPILIVYDDAGNLIGFNDDASPASRHAKVDQLPGNQQLVAVVCAFNEGSIGDFKLSFNGDEVSTSSSMLTGTISGTSNANIRSGPGTNFGIVATALPGTVVNILGRTADGSWLALTLDGQEGWIASFLVSISGDIESLPVGDPFLQSSQPSATNTRTSEIA